MKRIIFISLCVLLCILMVIGSFGFGMASTASAVTSGKAVMFNGFNSADDVNRVGAISLAGSATKSLDTTSMSEGVGSLKIDMPATNAGFINPYAFYTDIDGTSYHNLSDYNFLEIYYCSKATLSGTFVLQARLIDTSVSVDGSGYDYQVAVDMVAGRWGKATIDLSTPFETLAGMKGRFNRIRLVLLNYTGSYMEMDINFDGIVLCDSTYKNERDTLINNIETSINNLPTPTIDNLSTVGASISTIEQQATSGVASYYNFVIANYGAFLQKKDAYNQLLAGRLGASVLFNGFDSTADFNATTDLALGGNSTKAIDNATRYEGTGSLKIDMPSSNANFLNPYGYYFDINHSYIDISKYKYIEVMYKSDVAHSGSYNLQLHLIDTAISVDGTGYDYDSPIAMNGNWNRLSQDLSTYYATYPGIGNNINRLRFILLNYTGAYKETDMNIDSIFLCSKDYYDTRLVAEVDVAELISALPNVTVSNYESLAGKFATIEGMIANGRGMYVNFMPANYSVYLQKKALYDKYAAGVEQGFSMPNFFTHNMLFQQNKDMKLFGMSTSGKVVSAELYAGSTLVDTASATVNKAGEWVIALPARKGDYTVYSIQIKENGTIMKTITNVLVGELWLAAGQSNMEYRLDWEIGGAEEMANANDTYMRILYMVGDPIGSSGIPVEPARYDIDGANWLDASKGANIAGVSSNGYYAAKVMREKLNVPVGIINAALGSTNIQTWLSREIIDGNEMVKSCLELNGLYITENEASTKTAVFTDMSAMYNTKIAPMEGLNIGGIFWCQGESNVDRKPNELGYYKEAIQALSKGYGKKFGFADGKMPTIVINIANQPYHHDAQCIPKWIEEISDACKESPHIINIPLYDVGYTYSNPPDPSIAFPIHPNTKKPGGTRAGLAAAHNFCGYGEANYYAPTVKTYEVRNGAIFITFDGVADGLTTLDNSIGVHGFTISEKDGMFIPAKAEITSKNMVKIWHEDMKNPKNFTYAFNSHSITANLCNSYLVPAIPYRSDRNMTGYFCSNDWMYCEDTSVYINIGASGKEEPTWQAGVASQTLSTLTVDNNVRYEGTGSLKVSYKTSAATTTGATLFYGYYLMPFPAQTYKTISVAIKNPDARDKKVSLLFGTQTGVNLWKAPLSDTESTKTYSATLKANSDFTIYTFALDNLVGLNTTDACNLATCNRMEIMVEDSKSGTVYIDGFSVGVLSAEDKVAADKAAAKIEQQRAHGQMRC